MRLFVAAELPEAAVDALVAWRPEHKELRLVPRESLHVTLAFLGERDEGDVPVIGGLLDGLARPVDGLSLSRARWLPNPKRARVLAVELADGELAALQAELVDALAASIGFEAERRRFLPHVTVARVRNRAPSGELPELPYAGEFCATYLTLFRSRLSPKGASYEALARASLRKP